MELIEGLLPQWQFSERHTLVLDGVTPVHAYASIIPGLSTQAPLVNQAIALREVPGRLLRALGLSRNGLPSQAFGVHSFALLGQVPNKEIAFGLAGRFWQLDYGLRPVANAQAFAAMIDQPRLVLNVCVEPLGDHSCRLVTHTRVHCPDEAQRRRFAPYWYVIRPVSGLIRQRMLRRIAKLALATSP
ncbi:hypothetical protein [Limnohabitans sp. T6-20]|uniref:hypothetical protein n=1 Tax=Limnohabitans sp. T6-20 TaxID=1100725 RepID=UPI000D3328E8|nr:hypothetical protein [Limnohabitans sp. T6-20]PUE07938.1 hypothetical protein B9Z33_13415 [Limnohabitans sp. T6-20]